MKRMAGWVVKSLVSASVLLGASAAFAGNIAITGTLPKVLTTGQLPLTIVVTGLTDNTRTGSATPGDRQKGAADPKDEASSLAARFNFILKDCDSGKVLPFVATAAGDIPKCNAYVQYASPHKEEQVADGTWTYTYYINIIGTDTTFATYLNSLQSIGVSAYFFLGDTAKTTRVAVTNPEVITLTKESYVVADAPAFSPLAVQGSNGTLIVNWTASDNVNIKGGAAGGAATRAVDSVTVYMVDSSIVTSAKSLPAHASSLDVNKPDTSLPAGCTYTPPTTDTGGACISCTGGDNIYLDPAEIKTIAGFQTFTNAAKGGQVAIPGLKNGTKYWFFLQYQPQGIAFSTCIPATPKPNFSLTEINGEGEASYVDFRCFIATAAYGSPLAPDVRLFRNFRDDVLLKSSAGRAFVDFYYTVSPPLADFIAAHDSLRAVTRGLLAGPAWLLRQLGSDERM